MASIPSSRRSSMSLLQTVSEDGPATPTSTVFDVVSHYSSLLSSDSSLALPIAAIQSLSELILQSPTISTISELLSQLNAASSALAASSPNSISVTCGTNLFMRFLTLQRPPPEMSFNEFKSELVEKAREFVRGSGRCREAIAEHMAEFIRDGNVVLVHGYSRVVVQALLFAANQKKRFQVYVTESRPYGLGLKTHALLTAASIDCVVILDSAVSFYMGAVDMCLVGAEAVCESGGLVNFIGGYQMAIAAKAWGKPLYALAESYKFTRLFPLSQYDLPSSSSSAPLSFHPLSPPLSSPETPSRPMIESKMPVALEMTDHMIQRNPTLDYTTPDLIKLIVTDLGAMTPSGVSDALLGIYGGE